MVLFQKLKRKKKTADFSGFYLCAYRIKELRSNCRVKKYHDCYLEEVETQAEK